MPTEREHLRLCINRFPDQTDFPSNSQDIILLSHVAHYLTGDAIRAGLAKIHEWLKPGGRFFFQALTPFSGPFSWARLHADIDDDVDEWPGYIEDVRKEEAQFYGKSVANCHSMPNFGHPISPTILERELRRAGFDIEFVNYDTMNVDGGSYPFDYHAVENFVKGEMNASEEENFAPRLSTRDPKLLSNLFERKNLYAKSLEARQPGAGKKGTQTFDKTRPL